jgi:hypothetical protein
MNSNNVGCKEQLFYVYKNLVTLTYLKRDSRKINERSFMLTDFCGILFKKLKEVSFVFEISVFRFLKSWLYKFVTPLTYLF